MSFKGAVAVKATAVRSLSPELRSPKLPRNLTSSFELGQSLLIKAFDKGGLKGRSYEGYSKVYKPLI